MGKKIQVTSLKKVSKQKVVIKYDIFDEDALKSQLVDKSFQRGLQGLKKGETKQKGKTKIPGSKVVDRTVDEKLAKDKDRVLGFKDKVKSFFRRLKMPTGTGQIKIWHFNDEVLKKYLQNRLTRKCISEKCKKCAREQYSYSFDPAKDLKPVKGSASTLSIEQHSEDKKVCGDKPEEPGKGDDPLYYAFLRSRKKTVYAVQFYGDRIYHDQFGKFRNKYLASMNFAFKEYRTEFYNKIIKFVEDYKAPTVQMSQEVLDRMRLAKKGADKIKSRMKLLKQDINEKISNYENCLSSNVLNKPGVSSVKEVEPDIDKCLKDYSAEINSAFKGFDRESSDTLKNYILLKLKYGQSQKAVEASLSEKEKQKKSAMDRRMRYKMHADSRKEGTRLKKQLLGDMAKQTFSWTMFGVKAGLSQGTDLGSIVKEITGTLRIAHGIFKNFRANKSKVEQALLDVKVAVAAMKGAIHNPARLEIEIDKAKQARRVWLRWRLKYKDQMNNVFGRMEDNFQKWANTKASKLAGRLKFQNAEKYFKTSMQNYREFKKNIDKLDQEFIQIDLKIKYYKQLLGKLNNENDEIEYKTYKERIGEYFKKKTTDTAKGTWEAILSGSFLENSGYLEKVDSFFEGLDNVDTSMGAFYKAVLPEEYEKSVSKKVLDWMNDGGIKWGEKKSSHECNTG